MDAVEARVRVVAADLGGTRLKAAVVDVATARDALVGPVTVRPTTGLDGERALGLLIDTVRELAADGDVDAVGVALPGVIDGGRVAALPGKFPGLAGLPVAARLQAAVGAPVFLVNDAAAAALGEAHAGAGVGHHRVVLVTLGTGVGTAVVEGGRLLGSGPFGGGILAGQMPLAQAPDTGRGRRDANGRRGTIEAFCAADALLDRARAQGCETEDLPALLGAWRSGHVAARLAIDGYRRDLVQALVALAHAFAPSAIVIGGGPVATDAEWLLNGLQTAVRERLWPGLDCTVAAAALGDSAALVGVAALASAQLNAST